MVLTKRMAALLLAWAIPALAGAQQPAVAAPLVFDGVTVVDVERGELLPVQRVVIVGNRIQTLGPATQVRVPKGAQVVAAQGKYLIPGLWDLHVHPNHTATNFFYPLLLATGVTGMRDAGSEVPLDTLLQWRREILSGMRVGPPRQILSGRYISEEGYNRIQTPCIRDEVRPRQETCVSSASADAQHLVDSLKAAGADMIKPYVLSRGMYFAVYAAARKAGIPFGGHLAVGAPPGWPPTEEGVDPLEASDSGASIIDHMGPNGFSGRLQDMCWNDSATVERCQPVAERFRRNGTWLTPTLVHEEIFAPALVERVKDYTRAFWAGTPLSGNWLRGPSGAAMLAAPSDSLGAMHIIRRVNLPILASTDVTDRSMEELLPGFTLHTELAIYVSEGLTPLAALQSATLNPARLLHATDSLGTVAAGKVADLLLLDADPLADITNTTAIRAVVANGRYFDRAALDQLLADVRMKATQEP